MSEVDKFSKKIQNKGGKILMTKMGIPKIGWFATSQDTEVNVWNSRIQQEGKVIAPKLRGK